MRFPFYLKRILCNRYIDVCSQVLTYVAKNTGSVLPAKRKDIMAIWDVTIFLEMWIIILLYKYEIYGYS